MSPAPPNTSSRCRISVPSSSPRARPMPCRPATCTSACVPIRLTASSPAAAWTNCRPVPAWLPVKRSRIPWILPCGRRPSPASPSGKAPGARAVPAGISPIGATSVPSTSSRTSRLHCSMCRRPLPRPPQSQENVYLACTQYFTTLGVKLQSLPASSIFRPNPPLCLCACCHFAVTGIPNVRMFCVFCSPPHREKVFGKFSKPLYIGRRLYYTCSRSGIRFHGTLSIY